MVADPYDRLRRFCEAAGQASWIEKYWGIAFEAEMTLDKPRSVFRIVRKKQLPKILTYDLEWVGDGKTLCSLNIAFYAFLGELAGPDQFVSCALGRRIVTYLVLLGRSGPNAYGNALRFRVGGRAIERVLARTRTLGAPRTTSSGRRTPPSQRGSSGREADDGK
jgi:hypothetical protein